MANTYYDSQLTAEKIEQVLEAISGILTSANNGKVLAISDGTIEARSVQWGGGSAVLEPLSVTENGDYYPEAGVDGFDEVHVAVPSGSPTIEPLSVTQNGTYTAPSGVDGYSPIVVNVSGGGGGLAVATVTASGSYSSTYSAEKAFEGGFWGSTGGSTDWLRMNFQNPVKITGIMFGNTYLGSGNLHWSSTRVVFQASNDGSNWADLYDAQNLSDDPTNLFTFSFSNNNEYLYYRFLCYRGSYYAGLGDVQVIYNSSGAVVQPLSVTQNGTYNPPSGVNGYAPVTVNVSGGGRLEEYWDLTNSFVGEIYGLPADVSNITLDSVGALFPTNGALRIPLFFYVPSYNTAIEIETGSLNLTSTSHRRFIMYGNKDSGNGFIYRSTGKWAFYNGSWVESSITDPTYFDNCIVKVTVDDSGYWHIYKNDVLIWEPTRAGELTSFVIGSTSGGLQNSIIKSIRIYYD